MPENCQYTFGCSACDNCEYYYSCKDAFIEFCEVCEFNELLDCEESD